jgi:hypothetical protein
MRPVVDIIADVVTAMKPIISAGGASVSGGGATVTVGNLSKSVIDRLFIAERVKLTYSGGVVVYATITTIGIDSIIITLPASRPVPPSTIAIVLNYHHGHLLEIKNIFQLATQKATLKLEQFPAIVLVQDFPEKTNRKQHERIATVRILILTDSKQAYTAAERYTNTFEPKLYPLEDLFLKKLESSKEIGGYEQDYVRYDRLFWGRATGEGTASNIFNDFIDAIELENLNLKILNTC